MAEQSEALCLFNGEKEREKGGEIVNDGNHISTFCDHFRFYHHFHFSATFPSSKFACIYQQQQNRLNFAPKSIFASLYESRPCSWREIRFLELSSPLHLTSPALIKQTAREQLLVYKRQSHFISERDPESKKHEWAVRLIHPEPQPISVQRSPLDRLLRESPLSSNLTRCARWTPDTRMRFGFTDTFDWGFC